MAKTIDVTDPINHNVLTIYKNLVDIKERTNQDIDNINNSNIFEAVSHHAELKHLQAKQSQIDKIVSAFEKAYFPDFKSRLSQKKLSTDKKPKRNKPLIIGQKNLNELNRDDFYHDTLMIMTTVFQTLQFNSIFRT